MRLTRATWVTSWAVILATSLSAQTVQDDLVLAQRTLEARHAPADALPIFARLAGDDSLTASTRGQAVLGQVNCLLMLGRVAEATSVCASLPPALAHGGWSHFLLDELRLEVSALHEAADQKSQSA